MEVLGGEGGGQVGGVGGDHDEGEEIPHPGYEPGGEGPGRHLAAHPHDGRPGPPQRVVDVQTLGDLLGVRVTRVVIDPLHGGEPGHHEQSYGDQDVGETDGEPESS